MPNRETAIARALDFFDTDGFRERLAGKPDGFHPRIGCGISARLEGG